MLAGGGPAGYSHGVAVELAPEPPMHEVTRILSAIEQGDAGAAEQLLPLVYDELRQLASARMAAEPAGHTLDATALVHEAYLRLLGGEPAAGWSGRGHFFAAAAEAMRRILVESARRKLRLRHGGALRRHDLDPLVAASPRTPDELVTLSDALDKLAVASPQAAELVKLRFFTGLTNEDAAAVLGVSPRKANQIWAYARAWLLECLGREPV
jgi:RNA polymerase sigma factor (TIGR02999 family)